jgi:polygalacturonase
VEEFGAVGDGVTSNTAAFRRAVAALEARAGGGGARLEVPPGRWVTGSFNLTSRFTLFLHHGAIILGSQVIHQFIFPFSFSFSLRFLFFSLLVYDPWLLAVATRVR